MAAYYHRVMFEVLATPDEEDWTYSAPSEAGTHLREAVASFRDSLVNTVQMDCAEAGEDELEVFDHALPEAETALALIGLECLRRQIDLELTILIAKGLTLGLSWHQMAGLLGMTRQALHKRYAEKVLRVEEAAVSMDSLRDLAAGHDSQPDLGPLRHLLRKIEREAARRPRGDESDLDL
ncbi:hypothetical protein [Micromonospora chersina]|uniref:hypothetical protein n=1 Tax=Micromonospora chersina TaxID=47854 RepID=UPI0033BFFCCC